MNAFLKNLFLNNRLFLLLGVNVALFFVAYLVPALLLLAQAVLLLIAGFVIIDIYLVFGDGKGVSASRKTPEKFSNGDQNPVKILLENHFRFTAKCIIVDEVPVQFQLRDLQFEVTLAPEEKRELEYLLRPVTRGEYGFGDLHVFASGVLGLVRRRFTFSLSEMVPVYPSYIQMRKYQLMAISNRLTEMGVKKIRRLGHTTEFEQIKEYIRGDDYRTVNWKATARASKLMVNQYTDERAQNVYCLVDKSRAMKMPFKGMTLLDYAINAALVLSNIAIFRQDKGGLITFAEKISSSVPASSKVTQMSLIMEVLYNQTTRFLEADYARLYTFVKRKIAHRSLLILFTNFESVSALRRQLPYLIKLAQYHLLVVIFFENTELRELLESEPMKMEDIYIKTIGENFAFEKKQIVRELEQHGIISILTPPENLTVNTVNKYLEVKSRGMI